MPGEPEPDPGLSSETSGSSTSNEEAKPEQGESLEDRLKKGITDFHGYDEEAAAQMEALSFYFSQRAAGLPLPMAATATCQNFGHDAPRGMCRRCGLGVDLGDESRKRERKRAGERQAWLATRGN